MALGRTNINLTEIPVGYEQLVNYVLLYNEGVEDTAIAGGMSGVKVNGGSVTENATNVYLGNSTTSASACGYLSNNQIDCTPYKSLLGQFTGASKLFEYFRLAVLNTRSITWKNVESDKSALLKNIRFEASITTKQTKVLDISDINTNGYVGIAGGTNHTGMYGYIHNIALFKPDDITTLATKAGIVASSIDDILSASSTLLANKDAVNFMVARCTGDFMASAIASETFLTALNNSPYKSVVQSNEHWAKFLAMVA